MELREGSRIDRDEEVLSRGAMGWGCTLALVTGGNEVCEGGGYGDLDRHVSVSSSLGAQSIGGLKAGFNICMSSRERLAQLCTKQWMMWWDTIL